jgi:cell wall-associated NlpC family hydrolase
VSATRAGIVEAARTFLGVPWVHQGRTTAGMDCCGFIVEAAIKAGAVPDVEFEQDYRREENGERMLALLKDYLEAVPDAEDARPGDVLALCDEQLKRPDVPRHLIILTQLEPYWKGIHASAHGVREHRLDILFKRRVHSVWRVRGVND